MFPRTPRHRTRAAALLGAAVLTAALGAAAPAGAAVGRSAADRPPIPIPATVYDAALAELADPGAAPPGANDWGCVPSAQHPDPVILLHGLGANQRDNWNTVSPVLYDAGYCVFSLTYGNTLGSAFPLNQIGGLAPMERSAQDVGAFVDRVLTATGAAKVDLVGHSEGGVVASQYAKFVPGAAAKIGQIVTLGSPVYGTNVALLGTLDQLVTDFGLGSAVDSIVGSVCQSCTEFLIGSDFNAALDAGGVAVAGPHYTTIATIYDQAAVPYTHDLISAPNATQVVLQNRCALDFTEHINLAFDPNAIGWILHALDPSGTAAPACQLFVPYNPL